MLINFFEEIFGKIVFRIGEYEFEGFRPFSYMELPWKNHKEMNEYMNGLEKENTPYSYKKFIYWDKQRHLQKMHIFLSRAFLFMVFGIVFLVLSVILTFLDCRAAALFSLAAAVIMIIMNKIQKSRAKKYHESLEMSQELFKSSDSWD